eukprot:SAG22_NODE_958_length_6301_cov_4.995324_4_plen_54_part_00
MEARQKGSGLRLTRLQKRSCALACASTCAQIKWSGCSRSMQGQTDRTERHYLR